MQLARDALVIFRHVYVHVVQGKTCWFIHWRRCLNWRRMQRQSKKVEDCNSEERWWCHGCLAMRPLHSVHWTRIFCACPPPVLPKELHHKNIPEKFYKIFDRIRQTVSGYRPGKSRNIKVDLQQFPVTAHLCCNAYCGIYLLFGMCTCCKRPTFLQVNFNTK